MSAYAAAAAEGGRAGRITAWLLRIRELGIVVALAALITVTAILEPRFIEADSIRNLALNASIFAILAVGQTLVIITRNVDLSAGSVLGLSAFLAGDLLSSHPGLSTPGRVPARHRASAPPAGPSTGSSSPGGRYRRWW